MLNVQPISRSASKTGGEFDDIDKIKVFGEDDIDRIFPGHVEALPTAIDNTFKFLNVPRQLAINFVLVN